MKVEYYSVDLKPGSAHTQGTIAAKTITKDDPIEITIDAKSVLSTSDTVLLPTIKNSDGVPLVAYVIKTNGKKITLLPVNVNYNEDGEFLFPAIHENTIIVRMGRAAGDYRSLGVRAAGLEVHRVVFDFH